MLHVLKTHLISKSSCIVPPVPLVFITVSWLPSKFTRLISAVSANRRYSSAPTQWCKNSNSCRQATYVSQAFLFWIIYWCILKHCWMKCWIMHSSALYFMFALFWDCWFLFIGSTWEKVVCARNMQLHAITCLNPGGISRKTLFFKLKESHPKESYLFWVKYMYFSFTIPWQVWAISLCAQDSNSNNVS